MEVIIGGIVALALFAGLIALLEINSRRERYMEKQKQAEKESEPAPLLGVAFPPEMEQEELDKREDQA
jgi:hypothetical protein